jgi:stearoyl-CoA desaturase (delta-9 desaturase)
VREIFACWLGRVNIFKTRKNWYAFSGWFFTFCLSPFVYVYFTHYFSWKTALLGFVYAMVVLGTVNIVWLHRYCTHHAFKFTHPIYRFIIRNLTIRIVPEEAYVVSHHVHHAFSEKPGDPYNAYGGRLYCFLAGELHQPIARNLSRKDYGRVVAMLNHTGLIPNTYEQYKKWGTVTNPLRCYAHYFLNWAFWYGVYYLIGGHALAVTIFGWSVAWAFGIRDFNYDSHGCGKDKRKDGVDFNRRDLSINQFFAGTVSGEWHNNHHLYPAGVRSGFLWWQLDTAYILIRFVQLFGGVTGARDYKERFLEEHYRPWRERQRRAAEAA